MDNSKYDYNFQTLYIDDQGNENDVNDTDVLKAWFVGATGENDKGEYTDFFSQYIEESRWENRWDDKFTDEVNSISVGDKIVLKSSYTRKNNLPFENNGKTVSVMAIKAIGTVTSNKNDGHNIDVEWTAFEPIKEWYGSGVLRNTLQLVKPDTQIKKALLKFVFENEEQDYSLCEELYKVDDIEPDDEDVSEMKEKYNFDSNIKNGQNLVVYGTPGCGKSFYVKNTILKDCLEEDIVRTTFYQDYTNTDFVGQILPTIEGENVTYKFNPGPFALALKQAILHPNNNVALVIEELNRGNAPSIFGDIFQLLDRKQGKSEYKITNVNLQKYLQDEFTQYNFEFIVLPSNLSIVATMNTSDQNVFTLDTAFKRRWDFEKIKNTFIKSGENAHPYYDYLVPGMENITWEFFVEIINQQMIEKSMELQSEDKQLGVFFVEQDLLCKEVQDSNELKKKKFAYKILEYIWDDVAKFDRTQWFRDDIKTLDSLIECYMSEGEEVFKNDIFKNANS